MTWSDAKDYIVDILETLGYTEVAPDEQTMETPSHQHSDLTYMIKSKSNDSIGMTSNANVMSHGVELTIFYADKDSTDYDDNRDSFNTVIQTIANDDYFLGELANEFEEIDELHQKGTFEFYYGTESC